MTLAIFLFISIILVGIQTAIPFLVKRTILFGITIPEKHIKNEQLLSYKKRYTFTVALLSCIVLASYVLWALISHPSEEKTVLIGTLIQFGVILFQPIPLFFLSWKDTSIKKGKQLDGKFKTS